MNVLESQLCLPDKPLLKGLIELYRFIRTDEKVEGHTIANGRLDMTILLGGSLAALRDDRYEVLPDMLVFPLTRQGQHPIRVSAGTTLINIKFYPHVLTRPVFQNTRLDHFSSWQSLFGEESTNAIRKLINGDNWPTVLDQFFENHLFAAADINGALVTDTIMYLEQVKGDDLSLHDLAKEKGLSLKTLERHFKRVTGLSTKVYKELIRFQAAVKQIRTNGQYHHGNLLEALGAGYYDQSHFVKTCRKLTGKNPKALFGLLEGEVTDFMYTGVS